MRTNREIYGAQRRDRAEGSRQHISPHGEQCALLGTARHCQSLGSECRAREAGQRGGALDVDSRRLALPLRRAAPRRPAAPPIATPKQRDRHKSNDTRHSNAQPRSAVLRALSLRHAWPTPTRPPGALRGSAWLCGSGDGPWARARVAGSWGRPLRVPPSGFATTAPPWRHRGRETPLPAERPEGRQPAGGDAELRSGLQAAGPRALAGGGVPCAAGPGGAASAAGRRGAAGLASFGTHDSARLALGPARPRFSGDLLRSLAVRGTHLRKKERLVSGGNRSLARHAATINAWAPGLIGPGHSGQPRAAPGLSKEPNGAAGQP